MHESPLFKIYSAIVLGIVAVLLLGLGVYNATSEGDGLCDGQSMSVGDVCYTEDGPHHSVAEQKAYQTAGMRGAAPWLFGFGGLFVLMAGSYAVSLAGDCGVTLLPSISDLRSWRETRARNRYFRRLRTQRKRTTTALVVGLLRPTEDDRYGVKYVVLGRIPRLGDAPVVVGYAMLETDHEDQVLPALRPRGKEGPWTESPATETNPLTHVRVRPDVVIEVSLALETLNGRWRAVRIVAVRDDLSRADVPAAPDDLATPPARR